MDLTKSTTDQFTYKEKVSFHIGEFEVTGHN